MSRAHFQVNSPHVADGAMPPEAVVDTVPDTNTPASREVDPSGVLEPSALQADVHRVFAEGGALERNLAGYRVRTQQMEMAQAVAATLEAGGTLVAEAGTGTGKTYAYLAPALLAGGKVLVSTGTKTLQDQLYARDLPQLVAALQMPATIALLKGRANYVCHLHLQRTQEDDRALGSRSEVAQLRQIVRFAQRTRTGDKAELAEIPDTAPIWSRVTSTRDTCLGSDCAYYRDCFVVQARKEAQEAEVVVVNHALFLADLALKDEGITDLLPAVDCVIFDEAHQLPDVATRFLGESVSSYQLLDLARDALAIGLSRSRDSADWAVLTQALEAGARSLRLACAKIEHMPGQKSAFDVLPERESFDDAIEATVAALVQLGHVLHAVRERHPDLELLARRGPELVARLQRWRSSGATSQTLKPDDVTQCDDAHKHNTHNHNSARDNNNDLTTNSFDATCSNSNTGKGLSYSENASTNTSINASTNTNTSINASIKTSSVGTTNNAYNANDIKDINDINGANDESTIRNRNNSNANWVRWVETTGNHVRLHAAPLSVAHAFSRFRPKGQAWILTSATLAVRNDFTHFTRQLGLHEVRTGQWESPFDYLNRGRLFVPQGIPEPNQPGFTKAFAEMLVPLLEASRGSALILCTTLRAVDQVHSHLADEFEWRGWKWPLLKQGERSRRELLDVLRTQQHVVLVGSASFWEGIDVPGDALTLVAIDKLPFAPPDDPVLEARIKESRKRGGNPFFEFQIPQAAIALKQGAGRLIRTENDWGVLMVGDRRMVEKPYGKLLWRGLPPFTRTRSLQEAVTFLDERAGAVVADES